MEGIRLFWNDMYDLSLVSMTVLKCLASDSSLKAVNSMNIKNQSLNFT